MNQMSWPSQVPPPPPSSLPPPMPVAFSGDRSEFFASGHARRRARIRHPRLLPVLARSPTSAAICGRTPSVDGDAAEYTGRGKELLIGFLIALAILVPIYLGYFLLGLEAERLQAFASIPLVVFFYLFGQFAIYRARRYRLTRTVWRGVRFWMNGSGWAYALRASLWGLVMVLTLGLALPWRDGGARALQDAAFALRRPAGQLRGTRLGVLQARLVAVAARADRDLSCFRLRARSSTPRSRPWNGAGGCPASGSAACGSNSTLPRNALVGLYWKVIGWSVLLGAGVLGSIWRLAPRWSPA